VFNSRLYMVLITRNQSHMTTMNRRERGGRRGRKEGWKPVNNSAFSAHFAVNICFIFIEITIFWVCVQSSYVLIYMTIHLSRMDIVLVVMWERAALKRIWLRRFFCANSSGGSIFSSSNNSIKQFNPAL